jgi:hypothetical protein
MAVFNTTTITANYFNSIQSKISSVILDEYSYTSPFPSQQVSTGSFITVNDWYNLWYDITRCKIHQTNTLIGGISELPSTSTVLTASFATALENAANDAYTNRYTIHPNQRIVTVLTDTRTLQWFNSEIGNITYFRFDDSQDLGYWLNLGGSISIELTYPTGSYSGYDLFWKNLIDTANATLSTYIFDKNNSSTLIQTFVGPDGVEDPDVDSDGRIEVSVINNGSFIECNIVFEPLTPEMASPGMSINVGSKITLVTSSGNSGPIPYGIPSPQPEIEVNINFDEQGAVPLPIKYIKASPPSLTYSFERGQSSTSQTITILNRGNQTVTISDIIANGGSVGVTPSLTYSWGSTPVTTIDPLSSKTFTVSYSYSGGYEGINYSTIAIYSDAVINPVTINVTQNILKPVFDFTLNPTSWNRTLTTADIIAQDFVIVPKLFTNYTSYTASISPTNSAFTVIQNPGSNPRVVFNPFLTSSGTYTPILTVQATDGTTVVTRTASINISYTVPPDQHLGNWLSAGAYNNAVIGASYDIIRGVRYVTVGVGVGSEDGTPEIISGGYSYAILSNLGINADSKLKSGIALFKTPSNVAYTQFLNDYGVWIRSSGDIGPLNTTVKREYKINVTTAATYNWLFAVDNYGSILIDNETIVNISQGNGYSQNLSGAIYLTAGEHSISMSMTNVDGPSSIAFRLYTSTIELWNTLDPVRSVVPYYYWKEVYRVPLTNGAFTYDSKNYIIKDYSPVAGNRYGGFFSSSNLFKVIDDGFGNIEIILQPKTVVITDPAIENTLNNLQYSFYYYALYNSNNQRVNNLSGPEGNGNQTRYFVGFTNSGVVRTTLVNYPIFGAGSSSVWNNTGDYSDSGQGNLTSQTTTFDDGSTLTITTDTFGNIVGVTSTESTDALSAEAVAASLGLDTGTPGTSTGDGGGSGDKIICTAMNEQYGFGSFRNAIWLAYADRHLTKAHEVGYHTIFLPLVEFGFKRGDGKFNLLVRNILEWGTRHRAIDLRAEMRGGRRDLQGRIIRMIFEPLCYIVGKLKGY